MIVMGRKQTRMPFCSACGSWLTGEAHVGGTASTNEARVLDLLEQKDLNTLGALLEKNAELPSIEIYFQGCKVCQGGDSRLVVRRATQGSKGLQFTDAAHTILPARDSALLLNRLSLTGD
jgi:hypothetical protein